MLQNILALACCLLPSTILAQQPGPEKTTAELEQEIQKKSTALEEAKKALGDREKAAEEEIRKKSAALEEARKLLAKREQAFEEQIRKLRQQVAPERDRVQQLADELAQLRSSKFSRELGLGYDISYQKLLKDNQEGSAFAAAFAGATRPAIGGFLASRKGEPITASILMEYPIILWDFPDLGPQAKRKPQLPPALHHVCLWLVRTEKTAECWIYDSGRREYIWDGRRLIFRSQPDPKSDTKELEPKAFDAIYQHASSTKQQPPRTKHDKRAQPAWRTWPAWLRWFCQPIRRQGFTPNSSPFRTGHCACRESDSAAYIRRWRWPSAAQPHARYSRGCQKMIGA